MSLSISINQAQSDKAEVAEAADYYASITDSMSGSTLLSSLKSIINNNSVSVSYDWSRYEAADEDPNNQCLDKFSVAKEYFEGLTKAQRNTFMTSSDYVISSARERLQAWAKHQGQSINVNNDDYVINRYSNPVINYDYTLITIIVVSGIGIISLGGYFFLRKRKNR